MQRSRFLQWMLLGTAAPFVGQAANVGAAPRLKTPPYLMPGDVIGITSPAGFATLEELSPCIQIIESWGFKVKVGNTIGQRDGSFGGTDVQRAADFNDLLGDDEVKAILCAKGGYGAARMVDQVNWKLLRRNPKWVIGFSDITVLHAHINRHVGVASIHSKMCNSFPTKWEEADAIQQETILSIYHALTGKPMLYQVPATLQNKLGEANGRLIGGNLKILETLSGTPSEMDMKGGILFIEDVGEALYNIDRMMQHLLRCGQLKVLAALLVGSFTGIRPETPEQSFGRDLYQIIHEATAQFNYPIAFNFCVGHQKNNHALKCGVPHHLVVESDRVSLKEIRN